MASTERHDAGSPPRLRERAEALARAAPYDTGVMSAHDVQQLVHELQIHQIELAMQNESLREAQIELERSRDRLRDLYDFAPVGYLSLDGEAVIREANVTLAALVGVGREELIGRRLTRFIASDSQDAFYFHQLELTEGLERRRCELRLRSPGDTEYWVRMETLPVEDEETGARLYRAAISDISARKEAEEQLRLQLRLTERISACAGEAIFVTDNEGRISQVNAEVERLFGFASAELVGRSLHQRLHHHDDLGRPYPEGDCPVCRVRDPKQLVRGHETRFFGKAGEPCEVICSSSVLDIDGEPFGGVVIAHDITARKRAERALAEANRRKDEFLATLAHELRNPLAPIANALGVLKLMDTPGARARSACDIIDRQVQHLVRLIDDLVEVSRLTRGKLSLRRERVDLGTLIESALESVRSLSQCAGLELRLASPEPPVELEADPVRLTQVFANLFGNACKFTDAGGRVEIGVERGEAEVAVRVRDNGIGIAAEDLPRLFEMFTQVGDPTGDKEPGLGIGLALARGLVELHGGRIVAHSAGLGQGSELVVHLPLVAGAVQPPALQQERTPALAPAPAPRRVLVVDDQPDIVDSLRMLLEANGHDVLVARDGDEAVRAAERHRPEVVLLDLGMPRLDGYSACRRIRAARWGQAMRLIALTGWGQDVDRQRSAEAGFDRHLVKPVTPAALLEVVADYPLEQT